MVNLWLTKNTKRDEGNVYPMKKCKYAYLSGYYWYMVNNF